MLSLLLPMLSVTLTLSYPTGAPQSACSSLLPDHYGGAPQQNTSPYEIGVSSLKYVPGKPMTITISTNQNRQFRAFVLQARTKPNNGSSVSSVGMFSQQPAQTRIFSCFNNMDTITHSTSNTRNIMQITWTPPNTDVGPIVFLGTVAETKLTYWGVLSSGVLNSETSGRATTSTSVTSSAGELGTASPARGPLLSGLVLKDPGIISGDEDSGAVSLTSTSTLAAVIIASLFTVFKMACLRP